mmetsp:Transcript_66756/g.127143  ORF Transcript_66756/g.127143 Transcript_66756/m.127143 type:complete len:244 (-) Transcript_66756:1454-2185(-)
MTLHALLGDGLRHTLRDTALELTCQQIAKPSLKQRHHTSQEEEPDTPAWGPEPTAWTLADRTGVEPVVDQMLQILAHAHLPHQSVLVTVHTGQLTDMGKDVLQTICKLEGINVTQAELHMTVNNQLCQTHDFAAQMECISESGLFPLLGCERLHWLQVEVVIEVQEVEILSSNQQVEHIVALAADLQADLDPIQLCALEELRGGEDVHQISLVQRLRWSMMQLIQHPDFEQLLVRDPNFYGIV